MTAEHPDLSAIDVQLMLLTDAAAFEREQEQVDGDALAARIFARLGIADPDEDRPAAT